jgi:HEAT repeat protein
MTTDEAIAFLWKHQPMPADAAITEELITQFDEARRALEHDPDPRGLPLLLNAFGEGSGFGVYQMVGDTLRAYPRDAVIAALEVSLKSPNSSVRSWSIELAGDYPDERLIPEALALLSEPDRDTRFFAAAYIVDLGPTDSRVNAALAAAAAREEDPEIVSILREASPAK